MAYKRKLKILNVVFLYIIPRKTTGLTSVMRPDSISNLHLPASLAMQSKARFRGMSEALAFSHYLVMSSSKKR